MNIQDKKLIDPELVFSLEDTFPDAEGVFFGGFENLDDCARDALIVLDTNVLLMPYLLGKTSILEIEKVYKSLISKNKLFVPVRVAREFAKNRDAKVADIYASIQNIKQGKEKGRYSSPLINDLEEKKAVDEALIKLNEAKTAYYKSIDNLSEKIRSWEWCDPVSNLYSSLFNASVFWNHKLSKEELQKELTRRLKVKQPPGYKDSSKDDGGIGDLAIWLSLVDLGREKNRHVIFVSEEEKPDWWQKSNGAEFLPRYELVDEYRRESKGKSLHIVKLSRLLQLFDASNTAIEETKSVERMNRSNLDRIRHHLSLMKLKEQVRFSTILST